MGQCLRFSDPLHYVQIAGKIFALKVLIKSANVGCYRSPAPKAVLLLRKGNIWSDRANIQSKPKSSSQVCLSKPVQRPAWIECVNISAED